MFLVVIALVWWVHPTGTSDRKFITVDGAALRELPTSGAAWDSLVRTADGDLGSPDLSDPDSTNAGRTLAAALVFARTGQQSYRDEVVRQLHGVSDETLSGAKVLSVARQIGGYAIAADLVGHRDPAFVAFLSDIRTRDIGGHPRWYALDQTSEDTASNWGAWALASRITVDAYLGDTQDLARAAAVFRGFLGDRSAYSGFRPTNEFDETWVCGATSQWVPVNPADCGGRAGAFVEDISRSSAAYPHVDDVGLMYSWETLGGASLSAKVLSRHGYPDVYQWSDRALLRAARFLHRNGGYAPDHGANQHIVWMVNKAYGATLAPVRPAHFGRQYGYTDWLP